MEPPERSRAELCSFSVSNGGPQLGPFRVLPASGMHGALAELSFCQLKVPELNQHKMIGV